MVCHRNALTIILRPVHVPVRVWMIRKAITAPPGTWSVNYEAVSPSSSSCEEDTTKQLRGGSLNNELFRKHFPHPSTTVSRRRGGGGRCATSPPLPVQPNAPSALTPQEVIVVRGRRKLKVVKKKKKSENILLWFRWCRKICLAGRM